MIWCMAYDILYLNCVLKEVVIDDTTTIWRCSKDGMKRRMFWSCCKGVIRRPKWTPSMLFLEKASIPWWRRRKHVFFFNKKLRWKEWRKTLSKYISEEPLAEQLEQAINQLRWGELSWWRLRGKHHFPIFWRWKNTHLRSPNSECVFSFWWKVACLNWTGFWKTLEASHCENLCGRETMCQPCTLVGHSQICGVSQANDWKLGFRWRVFHVTRNAVARQQYYNILNIILYCTLMSIVF